MRDCWPPETGQRRAAARSRSCNTAHAAWPTTLGRISGGVGGSPRWSPASCTGACCTMAAGGAAHRWHCCACVWSARSRGAFPATRGSSTRPRLPPNKWFRGKAILKPCCPIWQPGSRPHSAAATLTGSPAALHLACRSPTWTVVVAKLLPATAREWFGAAEDPRHDASLQMLASGVRHLGPALRRQRRRYHARLAQPGGRGS